MSPTVGLRPRAGFTAVELLVVISIIIMVSAFSLPSITAAIRRGGVNGAADKVLQVITEAQLRARRQVPASSDLARGPLYGVAIIPAGTNSWNITLLKGAKLTDEAMVGSDPVLRVHLPTGIRVYAGFADAEPQPLDHAIGWFFLPGSGKPVEAPNVRGSTFPRPVGVGTPSQAATAADTYGNIAIWSNSDWGTRSVAFEPIAASPICSTLELRSSDGRIRAGIALYSLGLITITNETVDGSGALSDHGG
jgi:type II secretory pathway pseudopilin PulG